MPFRTFALGAGILVVIVLAVVIAGAADFAKPFRSILLERVFFPVVGGTGNGARAVFGVFGGGANSRIRALEDENARLRAEVASFSDAKSENEALRQIVELRNSGVSGAIPATVMGFYREGRDEYQILSGGARDGIGTGDLVVSTSLTYGGRVTEVGPNSAKVRMLSSPSESTDVVIPSRNIRAIARGNNAREMIIDLVPSDAEIAVGDVVAVAPSASAGVRTLVLGFIIEVAPAGREVFKVVRATHTYDPLSDRVLVIPAP